MTHHKVTADQILAWDPCYPESRIRKLFDRPMNAVEILTRDDGAWRDVPIHDRLWAVLRDELISAKILHTFACDVAERALHHERKEGREPDPRSWEAIRVKRLWIVGEASDKELAAARAAAWEAARPAAWAAAGAAAWATEAARAAAWEAARAAAWAAAWATQAARAAAWAAAWADPGEAAGEAAWAAAWADQRDLLLKLLGADE